MAAIVQWTFALWIVTHSAAEFFDAAIPKKPYNCQKCLAGWISLWLFGVSVLGVELDLTGLNLLMAWALSVLIEAVYNRLTIVVL